MSIFYPAESGDDGTYNSTDETATTWNPADKANVTLSNGNLTMSNVAFNESDGARTASFKTVGKWYYETVAPITWTNHNTRNYSVGVGTSDANMVGKTGWDEYGWGWTVVQELKRHENVATAYGERPEIGDIIMVAVDLDSDTAMIWVGKNGSWFSGDPALGTTPMFSDNDMKNGVSPLNSVFSTGGVGTISVESTFESGLSYSPPSGFTAWNNAGSGTFSTGNDAFSFGKDNSIFIRFVNVTIPQGNSISSATVKFTSVAVRDTDDVNVDLHFNDVDDSTAPTTGPEFVSLALTTAVDWDAVGHWGASGTQYDSVDVSAALQEIIDRPGWASGNAVTFLVLDDSSDNNALRAAYQWDETPKAMAELHVTDVDPCPYTVADLSSRVRVIVGDTSGQQWTDTDVENRIKIASEDMSSRSYCTEGTEDLATVSGTVDYAGPTDAVSVKSCVYNTVALQRISPRLVGHLPQDTTGSPEYWYFYNGRVGLYPVPDAIYTVTLYYARVTEDATEIPCFMRPMLVLHAVSKLRGADRWPDDEQLMRKMYDNSLNFTRDEFFISKTDSIADLSNG